MPPSNYSLNFARKVSLVEPEAFLDNGFAVRLWSYVSRVAAVGAYMAATVFGGFDRDFRMPRKHIGPHLVVAAFCLRDVRVRHPPEADVREPELPVRVFAVYHKEPGAVQIAVEIRVIEAPGGEFVVV